MKKIVLLLLVSVLCLANNSFGKRSNAIFVYDGFSGEELGSWWMKENNWSFSTDDAMEEDNEYLLINDRGIMGIRVFKPGVVSFYAKATTESEYLYISFSPEGEYDKKRGIVEEEIEISGDSYKKYSININSDKIGMLNIYYEGDEGDEGDRKKRTTDIIKGICFDNLMVTPNPITGMAFSTDRPFGVLFFNDIPFSELGIPDPKSSFPGFVFANLAYNFELENIYGEDELLDGQSINVCLNVNKDILPNCNINSANLFRYDEDIAKWENYGGSVSEGKVCLNISKFSSWSLGASSYIQGVPISIWSVVGALLLISIIVLFKKVF